MQQILKIAAIGWLIVGVPSTTLHAQAPPPDPGQLLVKGSVWTGPCIQLRPKKRGPYRVTVTVLERDGNSFRADLWNVNHHQRFVVGNVREGKIEWNGAPGETDRGDYNVGTINGKRIDIKYYRSKGDTEADGTFYLMYQGIRQ